jgi:hypothetical protein
MAQSIQRGLTREQDFETAKALLPSNIELRWGLGLSSDQVREAPFLKDIFRPLERHAAVLLTAAETISVLLEALRTAAEVLGTIIGVGVDLFEGVVIASKELLLLIRGLLADTAFHSMVHFPSEPKSRRKPSEILYDVGSSYLDAQDAKRPVAEAGSVGAVFVVMFSLPNKQAIADKINLIKTNLAFIEEGVSRVLREENASSYKTHSYKIGGSSGQAPDWDVKFSLAELPSMRKGMDDLDGLIKSLAGTRGTVEKINSAINTASLRIARVQSISDGLLKTITSLTSFLAFGDSNGVFAVLGNGGNEDFARAIINAPNHPDYPKSELNEINYGNYRPITAPAPQFADSSMYSGALAVHLQSSTSPQSLALVEGLWNALVTPKVAGKDQNLESYIRGSSSPLNERVQSMAEGYSSAWGVFDDED